MPRLWQNGFMSTIEHKTPSSEDKASQNKIVTRVDWAATQTRYWSRYRVTHHICSQTLHSGPLWLLHWPWIESLGPFRNNLMCHPVFKTASAAGDDILINSNLWIKPSQTWLSDQSPQPHSVRKDSEMTDERRRQHRLTQIRSFSAFRLF